MEKSENVNCLTSCDLWTRPYFFSTAIEKFLPGEESVMFSDYFKKTALETRET